MDFQLLYIASGKAHFHFDGKEKIETAGHMVLYRPKEPQKYEYYGEDQTEVYWVHFTGNDVTNILRSYGLTKDKRVFYCGKGLDYQNHFRMMIQELQMCREHYAEMLEMHLREIFVMIHRHLQTSTKLNNSQIAEDIDMATLYFSRIFKKIKGLTPSEYRKSINV